MVNEDTAESSLFLSNVQLRFLGPHNIDELKSLCAQWFPIIYPDSWYKDVTSSSRFFSLGATFNNKIVGVVVAEIRNSDLINKEDYGILNSWYPSSEQVAYILILGATKEHRRKGIGSILLSALLSKVCSEEQNSCKAVYLHVLTINHNAVFFYESRNFVRHSYLAEYYIINGEKMDGYCYVLYINGGKPPVNMLRICNHVSRLVTLNTLCRLAKLILTPFKLLLLTTYTITSHSTSKCKTILNL